MKTYALDTETTGLNAENGDVVEIAIVNEAGGTVLHSLVDPGGPIPESATAIHGITDADVFGCPYMVELMPAIIGICRGNTLVIYNKSFDLQFLPGVEEACASVECAMIAAQNAMGLSRWPRLGVAAEWAGYEWQGKAHTAIADALAVRHVWQHIQKLKDVPLAPAPAIIPLVPVTSSNILKIGYDAPSRTMGVRFTSGDLYHYADVPPAAYEGLLKAPSIGKHFAINVRDKFKFMKVAG